MLTQSEFNYQRIEKAILYLEENFLAQPTLQQVAEEANVSEFHFQKMFSEWAGISPKRFMQFLTVEHLKKKLASHKSLLDVAESLQLSSQARVYDLFTSLEAVTPQEYKSKGIQHPIAFGFHSTPFGKALIGISQRGVCWLSFLKDEADEASEMESMKTHWHNSQFTHNELSTKDFIQKIFYPNKNIDSEPKRLHALVKGTNFQVKVWTALLNIPYAEVSTYQQIASEIGNPNALQAVGSAVGANSLAYLIPCHRVIRKDGILGEYRWQATRKKCIIGFEMAQAYSVNEK